MNNKPLGLILAGVFGIIGAIPWIVIGYFGWYASIAGFIIGIAAAKGYEMGNGSMDIIGKIAIAILIILIVPIADITGGVAYLILNQGFGFVDAISIAIDYYLTDFASFLPALGVGYLMAFLGTYSIFKS
jgi:hypothetical protein